MINIFLNYLLIYEDHLTHKEELLDNWNKLQETGKYKKIKPLV